MNPLWRNFDENKKSWSSKYQRIGKFFKKKRGMKRKRKKERRKITLGKCKNARWKYDPPFLEITKRGKSYSVLLIEIRKERKKVMDKNGKPWAEYLLDFSSWFVLLEMENYPVRLLIRASLPIPWEFCVTGKGRERTQTSFTKKIGCNMI